MELDGTLDEVLSSSHSSSSSTEVDGVLLGDPASTELEVLASSTEDDVTDPDDGGAASTEEDELELSATDADAGVDSGALLETAELDVSPSSTDVATELELDDGAAPGKPSPAAAKPIRPSTAAALTVEIMIARRVPPSLTVPMG